MKDKDLFPESLKQQLDQFTVETPNFPMKKDRIERLANFFYSPVNSPLDSIRLKPETATKLQAIPLCLVLLLSAGMLLFV